MYITVWIFQAIARAVRTRARVVWTRLLIFLISLNKWRGVWWYVMPSMWTVTANILSKYSRVSIQGGRPARGVNSSPQKCFCVMTHEGQRNKFDVLCYLKK